LEGGRRENVNDNILYFSRSSDLPELLARTSRHHESGHIRKHLSKKGNTAANALYETTKKKMKDIENAVASISCEDHASIGNQQSQSSQILIQDEASGPSVLESNQLHISPNPVVSAEQMSPALAVEQEYTFSDQEGSWPHVSSVCVIDRGQVSCASEVSQTQISRLSEPEEAQPCDVVEVSQDHISPASEIANSALDKNSIEHMILDSDLITANALGPLGHDDKYNIEEQTKQFVEIGQSATVDVLCRDPATAQSRRCDGHKHDEALCKPMGSSMMPKAICHTYPI